MNNQESLSALGSVIGQQADQLWSISMAIIVAEIYIACRFFGETAIGCRGKISDILLYVSIISYCISLFAGYLVKGALVEMIKAGATGTDAQPYFDASADAALAQFSLLVLGLLLFVIVFSLNKKTVSKAILEK